MVSAPAALLVPPRLPFAPIMPPAATVRTRREALAGRSPESMRDQANSKLAADYSAALNATAPNQARTDLPVPPNSGLGQWRMQLRQALEDADFVAWLKRAGFDPASLEILPTQDSLSVRHKNGNRTRFTLQDGSPWAAFAAPILTAAKALSAEPIAYATLHAEGAPLSWVAHFLGEPPAEQALVAHKTVLANKRDLGTFRQALAAAVVRVGKHLDEQESFHRFKGFPSYDRVQGLAAYLGAQKMTLDPHSGFQLDNQPKAGQPVSLLEFMAGNGWDQPGNEAELLNMLKELLRSVESAPLHGDLGGGLSWPTPLALEQQRLIQREIDRDPANRPAALMQQMTGLAEQSIEPRQAIVELLKSPAAQRLGQTLRARFNGAGSPEDWALTALQVSLNKPALSQPNQKNSVAGFDLAQREHFGQPLSVVRQRLTEHLTPEYAENAPVAAYLLLSHHAPELLVNNVPANVTYGSPAWVSLKAVIAKAEMRAPGLAATKSYEQLLKEDLSPITAAEKSVEALAGQEALVHWAVADGALPKRADNDYSQDEIERAGVLANQRLEVLSKASEAQRIAIPTRKEMALSILKEHFKALGTSDFEKKVIWPAVAERELRGPYSLLDLYLDRPAHTRWVSTDPTVPVEQMFGTLRNLPPINQVFETAVADYYDGLQNATQVSVKHLMSLLPAQDKEALEYGELNVYAEEQTTRTTEFYGFGALGTVLQNVTSQQPDNARSLLFATTYKGKKAVYEVNPQQGFIRKRADLSADLKSGQQGEWKSEPSDDSSIHTESTTSIREVAADGAQERQNRAARPASASPVQTFHSARTHYIADAVLRHIFKPGERDKLTRAARGVTTFDTEVTVFEEIQAVTRALVPFASAAHSFQQGKVGEGLGFLAFDVFGFVVGGIGAARKILAVGGSAAKNAGIVTRAAIAAANPFAGGKAIVSRGLGFPWSPLGKATFGWKVISTNRSVNRVYQGKPKDVAIGTVKGADTQRIKAQLDEVSGHWYRYDEKNHRRYGVPLEQFRPENADASLPVGQHH